MDLTEVFFQTVHTRLPLLNPAQFRYRLKYALMGPNTPLGSNGMLAPGMSSPLTPQNGHSRNGHDQKPLHPASVIFLQSYTSLLISALRIFYSQVATVIAWGAKFSEHPLLLKDREHNNKQSALAKTLISRTKELAEDLKVHRIPTPEHVVTALLIEPMQSRKILRSVLIVVYVHGCQYRKHE